MIWKYAVYNNFTASTNQLFHKYIPVFMDTNYNYIMKYIYFKIGQADNRLTEQGQMKLIDLE